ncbi:MAG: hypothetical protein ACRC0X_01875 [Brevinema sp.]
MGENTEDLGDLTDDELEVYKFQEGISWDGVDTEFKANVIKAMRELYCDYMRRNENWKILEISSAYRDEKQQANAMVDYVLVKGRDELTKTYTNPLRKNPLTLISSLFYDGNHLICNDSDGLIQPCYHGSLSSCKSREQHELLEKLTSKEKNVFSIYTKTIYPGGTIDLQNNTAQMKTIMENWLKASKMKSDHQLGRALDFSSNNSNQLTPFRKFLDKNDLKADPTYDSGNFHVKYKRTDR